MTLEQGVTERRGGDTVGLGSGSYGGCPGPGSVEGKESMWPGAQSSQGLSADSRAWAPQAGISVGGPRWPTLQARAGHWVSSPRSRPQGRSSTWGVWLEAAAACTCGPGCVQQRGSSAQGGEARSGQVAPGPPQLLLPARPRSPWEAPLASPPDPVRASGCGWCGRGGAGRRAHTAKSPH